MKRDRETALPADVEFVHATCVAIDGRGVLLRGPSGSGKSDLALRLIQTPPPVGGAPAKLVSDDQVGLTLRHDVLWAQPAPNLAGKIEVRGLGIINMEHSSEVPVHLVVDATDREDVPRMPEPDQVVGLCGCRVPVVALAFLEASAPIKVRLMLASVSEPGGIIHNGDAID